MSDSYIFGFGTLMRPDSLLKTAPDAYSIKAAYVKGFRRDFSFWDSRGWRITNLDVAGPFCALDITQAPDINSKVNGVVFKVSSDGLLALKEREKGYKLIQTNAYDFETDENLGECLVFSSGKNNGQYKFDSPPQSRYLKRCLDAASIHGEVFYNQFLSTTFIGDKSLANLPDLVKNAR